MTQDKYYMKIRDSVLKKIKKKYIDIPERFHDTPTSSTSGDLFIDEISWLTIKKILCHFKLSSNSSFIQDLTAEYHCPHCKESINLNQLEKWRARGNPK